MSPNRIDARSLLRLPAARIRELAEAGANYAGSGRAANALLQRERALYRRPVFQPPVSDSDVSFPTLTPAPLRTVYGVEHTPTNYAALAPPYYGALSPHAPWMSETEETAWSDRDAVYPARPFGTESDRARWQSNYGPSFTEDEGESDALSGLYDILIGDPIAFWKGKWNEAKANLSAALVSISGTARTLGAIRTSVDAAIDNAASDPSLSPNDTAAVERARQTLVALEANQANLEGRVRQASSDMQQTASSNPDSGLGVVFPIVAVGVIVATIVGIVSAVVIHTQNVNALAQQVSLLAAGKITAKQLKDISGDAPSFPGLPNLSALGDAAEKVALLGVVALAAYFFLKKK